MLGLLMLSTNSKVDPLIAKGGIFAIVGDMYRQFLEILTMGVAYNANTNLASYSSQ